MWRNEEEKIFDHDELRDVFWLVQNVTLALPWPYDSWDGLWQTLVALSSGRGRY